MRLISITFPVMHFFPLFETRDAAINCMPAENEEWLLRTNYIHPVDEYVPGAIVDSTGLHVPIVGMKDHYLVRPKWAPLLELFRVGPFSWRLKFIYGKPEQLTVEQFKKKYAYHLIKKRGVHKNMKKLQSAKTHREIFASQYGEKDLFKYSPPRTMQIEVPDDD